MMDLTADYKCGNISKEEWQEVVSGIVESKYDRVMSLFKVRFGFRPYKVPKWRAKNILFLENKEIINNVRIEKN
jgi:hypothetical protein